MQARAGVVSCHVSDVHWQRGSETNEMTRPQIELCAISAGHHGLLQVRRILPADAVARLRVPHVEGCERARLARAMVRHGVCEGPGALLTNGVVGQAELGERVRFEDRRREGARAGRTQVGRL